MFLTKLVARVVGEGCDAQLLLSYTEAPLCTFYGSGQISETVIAMEPKWLLTSLGHMPVRKDMS
jgi:hypothetical protein